MDVNTAQELAEILQDAIHIRRQAERLVRHVGHAIQEDASMSAIDTLRDNATTIRTATDGLGDKLTALQSRLQNNPSETDIQAVADELGATATKLGGLGTAIDAIDPDQTGGGVVEDPSNPGTVTDA